MINKYIKKTKLNKTQYFQKIIKGEHISIQFYSKDLDIKILSICKQLFRKDHCNPFIIESIVSRKFKGTIINVIPGCSSDEIWYVSDFPAPVGKSAITFFW